ncbi:carboxypeptidase B-like [Styela clava]
MRISLALLVVGFVGFVSCKKTFEGDQVVSLFPKTNEHIEFIQSLEDTIDLVDFWSPKYANNVQTHKSVDIRFPRENLEYLKGLVEEHGIEYEVKIPDVQELIDNQVKGRKNLKDSSTYNYNVYHPIEEITSWTQEIAAAYPSLVTLSVLGDSFEGRNIPMLTISTNKDNPSLLLDCGFHAREWISPAFCQCFTRNLLKSYGSDPVFTNQLNKLTFHIVPVVNVDGYAYSWTDQRLWRKTRSNYGTRCNGTDPNRNCNAYWGGPGSSPNPCSDIYYGPAMESEIEVHALANFIRDNAQTIAAYITVHSYSQMIIYPYSYTYELSATHNVLDKYAKQMKDAIYNVFSKEYTYGSGAGLLYAAAGGSDDFAYDEGVPLSYTYELRDTGEYGFLLPENQIEETCVETTAGMKAIADGALELWHNKLNE